MINKIIKISGIGKFSNFSSNHDNLSFRKNTIIFGFNTYGKSTLTTIFRSLKKSDQKYIEGKKSFNHPGTIVVDILDDKNTHLTLANGNWKKPDIEIFDNEFVNSSVFVGNEIDYKHKSNLYGIFIGDDINQKVDKLKSLKEEQAVLEKKRDNVKLSYTKNDLGPFDIFLKIDEIADIEKRIKDKEKDIKVLTNIETLKRLAESSVLNDNFSSFSNSIQKRLDISADKKIEDHIKNHWNNPNSSKNFLAEGVQLLKSNEESCVFCGQNISPVKDLIKDFKKVFNKAYDELRQEILHAGESFLRIDVQSEISKFIPYGINFEEYFDKEILLESKKNLDDDIKIKLLNLNHNIDITSDKSNFQIFVTEIKKLDTLFKEIKNKQFSSDKIGSLKDELKLLNLSKYRFSLDGKKIEKEYTSSLELLEKKKDEIKKLREEIDKETSEIIDKNQTLLNETLKKLGADFSINKLTSKSNLSRLDSHFIDYEFVIQGQRIPISNKNSQGDAEPKDKYYFGNTLSDSDKRLLAMAFFIVGLVTNAGLKNKIVILDDPFSSFDSNRKDDLVNAIKNIQNENGDSPEQLIVLTHDDSFLARLNSKLSDNETRLLRIHYSKSKGSVLAVCNIDDIIEEQYFKDVKIIKKAIDNSENVDHALKRVRICLERLLKHKYFFQLDNETLATGSISSYLEKIGDRCQIKKDILDSDWHENMHDQHQIMLLSEPQKIKKLEDFLNMMQKI